MRYAICLCSCLWASLWSAPAGAQAQEITRLPQLLSAFAKLQGLSARYTEEKRIALLKRPLKAEGRVWFAAPDTLLRKAEKPEPSTVLLRGEKLSVADASGRRNIDLGTSPVVRHLVQGFVHVLSGDQAALERLYKLQFDLTKDGWRLQLEPKDAKLRKLVAKMTFEGRGVQVTRMTLLEGSGDETRMAFEDVETNLELSAAERQRLFRLPAE